MKANFDMGTAPDWMLNHPLALMFGVLLINFLFYAGVLCVAGVLALFIGDTVGLI